MDERMKLLHDAVGRHGQAAAARAMGYSPSAVNQALHGKYGGSLDNLLDRVEEIY
jgi:predicted transcriptional regulator